MTKGLSSMVVPPAALFELDKNLVGLNYVTRRHFHGLWRDRAWRSDIGFHLHCFQYEDEVTGLQLLTGMNVNASHDSGQWAPAHLPIAAIVGRGSTNDGRLNLRAKRQGDIFQR